MANVTILNYDDQVKTNADRYQSVFKIGSVEGYVNSRHYNRGTVKENLDRAIKHRHDLAWVSNSATTITSDYEGKDEHMRKEREAYANAIILSEGQIVEVEGRQYTVNIIPRHEDYSCGGINLVPYANHPYVK
tara:strand:- start:150 stop:548 length:399 start_codon:yes stop_codon:yes gene_type:complete